MRTLAIGDIHGCLVALETLLAAVALEADDTVVALGDFVDRGPDSRGVIDRLIGLHDAGQLVAILGNHDEMMLAALQGGKSRGWLWFGGEETLASYGHGPTETVFDRVPTAHVDFLWKACRPYYETETHLFAHAGVQPDVPMPQQSEDVLRWLKLTGPIRHASGKTLIVGHTKQRSGVPLVLDGVVCIDTGAYEEDGWLTCLDVDSGKYWQANERGETREGSISGS
ncbi:MAG: serine/threonine protein phosphatase [Gemmataceae bacterium]|nr:serine/threonine protein phosphatase [Gemmataceae bacterium]